jgi:hypothetical protein
MPLARIVVIFILYVDDIVLMAKRPYDLDKKLKILKVFCSRMGMIVNIEKTKGMIIKSKKINCVDFMYDNNNLEEVTSFKYLIIDIHCKLN